MKTFIKELLIRKAAYSQSKLVCHTIFNSVLKLHFLYFSRANVQQLEYLKFLSLRLLSVCEILDVFCLQLNSVQIVYARLGPRTGYIWPGPEPGRAHCPIQIIQAWLGHRPYFLFSARPGRPRKTGRAQTIWITKKVQWFTLKAGLLAYSFPKLNIYI